MMRGIEQNLNGLKLTVKRSLRSKQRRDAKRFIINTSYHDEVLAETAVRVTCRAVLTYLGQIYDFVFPGVVDVEQGEIIIDSRGSGTYQRR